MAVFFVLFFCLHYLYAICKGGVGKSSLMNRFVNNEFDSQVCAPASHTGVFCIHSLWGARTVPLARVFCRPLIMGVRLCAPCLVVHPMNAWMPPLHLVWSFTPRTHGCRLCTLSGRSPHERMDAASAPCLVVHPTNAWLSRVHLGCRWDTTMPWVVDSVFPHDWR